MATEVSRDYYLLSVTYFLIPASCIDVIDVTVHLSEQSVQLTLALIDRMVIAVCNVVRQVCCGPKHEDNLTVEVLGRIGRITRSLVVHQLR